MEKDQMKAGAYLNVAAKDPEYYFKKKMKPSQVKFNLIAGIGIAARPCQNATSPFTTFSWLITP